MKEQDDKESQGTDQREDGAAASRRDFTRRALVGGATIATLSSRSAWGTTPTIVGNCVSAGAWTSYNMNNFVSYTGGVQEAEALEALEGTDPDYQIQQVGDEFCVVDTSQTPP